MRTILLATVLAGLTAGLAFANSGAGTVISPAEARAAGAATRSASECVSICKTRSNDPANCSSVCVPGNCYRARNGGAYCVK